MVRLSEYWDALYEKGEIPWNQGRPAAVIVAAQKAGVLPRCKVIDLGCGAGATSVYMAKAGLEVTAAEISHTAIQAAEALARKESVDVSFVEGDVLELPFEEEFDLAFDRGCFTVLPPGMRMGYAERVYAALKPCGALILSAFKAPDRNLDYLDLASGPPYAMPAAAVSRFFGAFTLIGTTPSRDYRIRPRQGLPEQWVYFFWKPGKRGVFEPVALEKIREAAQGRR